MLRHPEDIEQIHQLTRTDVQKLRRADTISFHRSPTASAIDAKAERLTQATTELVWEHSVPAHSTLKWCSVDENETEGVKPLNDVAYCHVYHTHANNINNEWRTIASLLKVGDRIELIWYRDAGRNGYMKKADLHGDRLQVVIHRKARDPMLFLVESQCCENNTARMIRRGVYNNE